MEYPRRSTSPQIESKINKEEKTISSSKCPVYMKWIESVSNDRAKRARIANEFIDNQDMMGSKKVKLMERASAGSTTSFTEELQSPENYNKFGFKEGSLTPRPIGFKVKNLIPKVLADYLIKKKKRKQSLKKTSPVYKWFSVSGIWLEEDSAHVNSKELKPFEFRKMSVNVDIFRQWQEGGQ